MSSTAPDSDSSALPEEGPDAADGLDADETPNILAWRQRVLAGLLPWALGLGTLIALPSVVMAWNVGLHSVLWIDACALAWVTFLWRRTDLPYAFRAISLLGLLYGVGLFFLIVFRPIGQLYLMAFPVMTALLLGMRPAVLALLVNALTLPAVGSILPDSTPIFTSPLATWLRWPVMTANFTFISALMTLSTGVLLRGLAQALERQHLMLARWRRSEDSVRQITAQLPGMVYRVHINAQGERRYTYVSPGVRQIYGLTPEQVLADGSILAGLRHPDDTPRVSAEFARSRKAGNATNIEFRIILPHNGQTRWVQISSSAVHVSASGTVRSGVVVDITERKLAEARLRDSEARWQLALEGAGDGVWDWYPQTGVEIYSRRFKEMYGFAEDELPDLAEAMDGRTHPDDREQLERDRDDHFAGRSPAYRNEHRVRCKDGSWKWVLTRGMVISRDEQGRPTRVIGTHTDISESKQSEALIWQQANFDTLTGLPNRRMLRDRLAHEIRKCQREGSTLALLFIDLDHFKEVNDTLGHDRGDLLLVEASRRIGLCVRQSDTVARMGGDEFTVVLPELANTLRVEHIASEIIASIGQAFDLGDERAYVSASIGIARYPDDALALDELLKHADQALYAAKGQGRQRFSYFTPDLQASALYRVRLATDLHQALAHQQMRLVYQPIVHLASGSVHKAEALLRWDHPERGPVSPAVFIPLAESSGLIVSIGDWVFRQAAEQALRWRGRHDSEFQVSINKSPVQFRASSSAARSWVEHLAAIDLPGRALVVEITEGLLLEAGHGVAEQLGDLRRAGLGISLDDFGTGYSSLSYLQKFDIDFLKVDQSFVRGLAAGSKDLALCKAIIGMAHELGIRVIAEGVETAAQLALLTAAGCDYGQGYLFARPMPAAELDGWLSARLTAPA